MTRFPDAIERAYASRLVRRLRIARRLVLERLRTRSDSTDRADNRVGDEPPPRPAPPTATIDAVRRAFEVVLPLEEASLLPTARGVDAWADRQTVREVQQLVRVDLTGDTRLAGSREAARSLHFRWARENVELIKSMESRTFDDLAQHVADTVAEGRTDLARVIQDRFGVAEGRARLIARDQIASLTGKITQERQQAVGIDRYEWSTSGDERVRPKHRALDGKVFSWSSPPSEGHPGTAINCRCVAIPVLDDVDVSPPPPPEPPPPPARPSPLPSTFGGAPPRARPALPSTFGGEVPIFRPPSVRAGQVRADRDPAGEDPT